MQEKVHAEVERTSERSGWPVKRTLKSLGISPRTYYRWKRDRAWTKPANESAVRPFQLFEATAEERKAVKEYALKHTEIRHRELAWRMVDESVVFVSPSTVYRILSRENLVCTWRRRTKRYRDEQERAKRPDERWSTDLMHLRIGDRVYYLVCFMDEYSRYIVHWELLAGMDGMSVSLSAQAAIDGLKKDRSAAAAKCASPAARREARTAKKGEALTAKDEALTAKYEILLMPEIRSDNGSGYVSREFREVLAENGLSHQRIRPHCPEENGLMERANRTIREMMEGEELTTWTAAKDVLSRVIRHYNEVRLHGALGYLRPKDYYRGEPEKMKEERRVKLAAARSLRRQSNLRLRQGVLPFIAEEVVA